jgi:serine/threonine-protein kinase
MPERSAADRWQLLSPHLDHAFDLTTEQCQAWLAALRAEDATLAADLEALLRRDAMLSQSGYLEGMAPPPTLEGSLAGHAVGAYTLRSLIGQGGMGSVWLAERSDGRFEGVAAVKLLNASLVGREGEARFRREGSILARLRHPHIAQLIDAGISPLGYPYLVLEHIDGQRIDNYCDERRLGIDDRIRLFLDVLAAVAHAHANLIVHRDLKPPNVLVTSDGHVKLLDFGIAKLLDRDDGTAAAATLTLNGQAALTPEYAAPEQLTGQPVTTATDVYALGVLLYLLFTGKHPFAAATTSPAELIRAILETQPPRMSDGIPTGTARLKARLEGDLDNIVAKAVRKLPQERYPSAVALGEDLRRHLAHEPVSARPPTLGYRARRFVQRHRVGIMAAAIALLALVSGLTAAVWEGRVAKAHARRAEEVKRFLADIFQHGDPGMAAGGALTARELVDLGASRVRTELRDQPEVQAEMMTLLGSVYTGLGVYDRGEPLLKQAIDERRSRGEDETQVADSMDAYGELLNLKGEKAEAETVLRESLAIRERRLGAEHVAVAASLDHLANLLRSKGRYAEAETLFRRAIAVQQKAHGHDHRDVAESIAGLAWTLSERGDLAGAEALYREALDIRQRVLGDQHPDVIESLCEVAVTLFDKADYAGAEALYRKALAQGETTVGPDHPTNLRAMVGLATVLAVEDRNAEAEPILRETLGMQAKRFGARNPQLLPALNSLARSVLHQGRPREAERLYGQALSIAEERYGPQHHEVAKNLHDLAGALLAQGQLDRAEALYRRCVGILTTLLGHDHPHVGRATTSLGDVLLQKGDVAAAEKTYQEALRILRARLAAGHDLTASAALGLGRVRRRQGRRAEAEALLREAYVSRRAKLGAGDTRTATAALELAECMGAARTAEAAPLAQEALDAIRAAPSKDDRLIRRASEFLRRLSTASPRRAGS